jgi:hypothetical protein
MGLKAMNVCYNKTDIFVLLVSNYNFNFNVEVRGQAIFGIDGPVRIFKFVVPDPGARF